MFSENIDLHKYPIFVTSFWIFVGTALTVIIVLAFLNRRNSGLYRSMFRRYTWVEMRLSHGVKKQPSKHGYFFGNSIWVRPWEMAQYEKSGFTTTGDCEKGRLTTSRKSAQEIVTTNSNVIDLKERDDKKNRAA